MNGKNKRNREVSLRNALEDNSKKQTKKAPDQMFIMGELLIYLTRDLVLINPSPFNTSSNFTLTSSSTHFFKGRRSCDDLQMNKYVKSLLDFIKF